MALHWISWSSPTMSSNSFPERGGAVRPARPYPLPFPLPPPEVEVMAFDHERLDVLWHCTGFLGPRRQCHRTVSPSAEGQCGRLARTRSRSRSRPRSLKSWHSIMSVSTFYGVALDFLVLADNVIEQFPRARRGSAAGSPVPAPVPAPAPGA